MPHKRHLNVHAAGDRLSIELDSEASSQGAESNSPLKDVADADDAYRPSTSDPAAAQHQSGGSHANGPGHQPRPAVAASPFAGALPEDVETMGASPDGYAAFLARHSLLGQVVLLQNADHICHCVVIEKHAACASPRCIVAARHIGRSLRDDYVFSISSALSSIVDGPCWSFQLGKMVLDSAADSALVYSQTTGARPSMPFVFHSRWTVSWHQMMRWQIPGKTSRVLI